MSVRLLLADDHDLIRQGLKAFGTEVLQVVCEASDGQEALRLAAKDRPDVALISCMPFEKSAGDPFILARTLPIYPKRMTWPILFLGVSSAAV